MLIVCFCDLFDKSLKTKQKNFRKVSKDLSQVSKRCGSCRQLLDSLDLHIYEGHPQGAVEESVALVDPRLSLFTGDESEINESDVRPLNKLTSFRFDAKNSHHYRFDILICEVLN